MLASSASTTFFDHAAFQEMGQFFVEISQATHWQSLLISLQNALFGNLFATILTMMVFLLGVVCYQRLLWFSDRTVKRAIRDEHISSLDSSRLFLTALATAILCWSPLLCSGIYLRWTGAISTSPDFQHALGSGLIVVFAVTVTLRLLQEFYSKGGLSEAIYGLQHSTARYVLNRVELTILFSIPMIFLIVFTSQLAEGRWYQSVGRFSFLMTLALLFSQFQQLLWPASKLYQRLSTDEAVANSIWVRHRVSVYVIGMSMFLVAAGLTVSGWLELAKDLSIRAALTMFVGVIAYSIRTIVSQKVRELVRHTHLIEDLGQSADNIETVRSPRVQDFVRRYSQAANRGVSFIAMVGFLAANYWIWRAWISLPPELLQIEVGGVALAGLVALAKLVGIGLVTWYLTAELPTFAVWCFSHFTKSPVNNPALVTKLIGVAIVYLGVWIAARSIALQLPVIPWLGTLLTISLLFAARQLVGDGFAGLVLLFDPRVSTGDCVEVEGRFGRVEAVNLFATTIEDNLGTRNVVPNSTIIRSIVVKSRDQQTIPMLIDVAVPRDADAHQAQALMMLVAQREPSSVSQPPPHVRFVSFLPHELRFQLRLLILASADYDATKIRLEETLALEFERHAIDADSIRRRTVSIPERLAG